MEHTHQLNYWQDRWNVLTKTDDEPQMSPKREAILWESKIHPSRALRKKFVARMTGRQIKSFNELLPTERAALEFLMKHYAEELQESAPALHKLLVRGKHGLATTVD